jgi:hypothetical protein
VGHVAPLLGRGDDGTGQRVFAVGLDAPGQAEDVRLVEPAGGDGGEVDHGVPALGQGPRLVEEDGVA